MNEKRPIARLNQIVCMAQQAASVNDALDRPQSVV